MRLAAPKGDFALPDPPPAKILFITAGSGITPVMAMLRTLKSRGQETDIVHIHSAPSADDVIFHDELRELESSKPGYQLQLRLTETQGHLDFDELPDVVADWRDRSAWACGPSALLEEAEKFWKRADRGDQLHMERFTIAATDKIFLELSCNGQMLGSEIEVRGKRGQGYCKSMPSAVIPVAYRSGWFDF